MEVGVANKWQKGQRSKLAAKKVECGPMLVNTGSGVGWKITTHPMDKTTNWCIGWTKRPTGALDGQNDQLVHW
jgi:hypothetical protein